MSCTLRAGGMRFDVDAFLKESTLTPCAVFHGGEPNAPALQEEEPVLQVSGCNVAVSDADFTDLRGQTEDALQFVKTHEDELKRLAAFPGVEGVEIDFAAAVSDALAQSYVFPPELLVKLGSIGIELCVSFFNAEG